MWTRVPFLALLSGLRSCVAVSCGVVIDMAWIWHCYSSDSTPSLETSICLGCGPKKAKKKKKAA